MTIFFSFDPAGVSDGVTLTSFGFAEYPARDADNTPHDPPHFRMSGGAVICDPFYPANRAPHFVKDLGSPIVRGEVRMKHDTFVGVLFRSSGLEYIEMNRSFYGSSTYALIFTHILEGVEQNGTFYYHAIFEPGSPNGNSLPAEVDVAWVVNDDDELEIYVQGKRCEVRDFVHGGYRTSMPIPANLIGATRSGYSPRFGNQYAFPFVLRDNADLIYCTSVAATRATASTSKLEIQGVCTKSGASHVVVDVLDSAGATVFHGIANVVSGAWSIETGSIGKDYEAATIEANIVNGDVNLTVATVRFGNLSVGDVLIGSGLAIGTKIASVVSPGIYAMSAPATASANGRVLSAFSELRVSAVNQEGQPEVRRVVFQMPRTLVQRPFRLGQNSSNVSYYGGFWPFRDLARGLEWRTSSALIMPVGADPAYFTADNGFAGYLPASTINRAPNGSPRKFPDNVALDLVSQLPWYPEPGVYVLDMSEAPDLSWTFQGDAGCVVTDIDYFGPKRHRVTITTPLNWIPTNTGSGFRILLIRDDAKPNKGMPSVQWELRFPKVGGTPGCEWSDSFLAWMNESGAGHYRWMSGQIANEPANLPRNITTAVKRAKLTDQSWTFEGGTRPEIPIELIVDLHNRTRKDLWFNIPRTADESYIRAVASYVRDHLDPVLKFFFSVSNEVWNFTQWPMFSYLRDGMAIGLGKGREATADITSGSNIINMATALYGRVQIGQRVIGRGIPPGTTITALGTGTGRTGTYLMSQNATRTATIQAVYDAPTVGGDGVYDYSSIRSWSPGMTVAAGELIANYHIFRALSSFTSSVNPLTTGDWNNYELVQHGDMAAWRAHAEHLASVHEIVRNEMGASAYAARGKLVVERWQGDFERAVLPYLDWGDLLQRAALFTVAVYFGNDGTFLWSKASADVRTATATLTGSARIAAWVTAAKAAGAAMVDNHRRSAETFVRLLEERGLAEGAIEFGTYEGGPEYTFDFRNAQLATTGAGPIDQAVLLNDILTFHEAHHYEIVREFYEALNDICGGTFTQFDSFSPTRHSTFFTPGVAGYLFWGASQDVLDRADTSTKYKAIRDLSVTYGGGAIISRPPTRRRRLAAVQLS